MTAPVFPGYPPQQQTYPPAQPQYPAQYPPQPQYAQPPQFPQAQGYPAPQYAPPPPPLATGSLDDFFSQPSTGGGKSLAFEQIGTRYIGIVTRPLGAGDIQQQTDTLQKPLFFKDGRPKFVMKVPLQMQPSPAYPDGLATWFVKGQARDELVRAMAEAGAPAGPPEAGAIIDITHTGTRNSGAGMNPAKLFAVVYTRPNGAPPAAAPDPTVQAAHQAIQQVSAQYAQPQQPDPSLTAYAQAAQPDLAAMQAAQQLQYAQAQQPVQQPIPVAPPAAQPLPPSDLTEAQQTLLAKLTGG